MQPDHGSMWRYPGEYDPSVLGCFEVMTASSRFRRRLTFTAALSALSPRTAGDVFYVRS